MRLRTAVPMMLLLLLSACGAVKESAHCDSDVGGETCLTVRAPEIAQGITATVSGEDAQVSYGDTTLAVEDFASRRISPMAAPYLLTLAWSEG